MVSSSTFEWRFRTELVLSLKKIVLLATSTVVVFVLIIFVGSGLTGRTLHHSVAVNWQSAIPSKEGLL
jgi:hypothetical protein